MERIIQTFTDFGNRKWKDKLHGGKADDKTPDDFPEDELEIGTKVEREHTDNPDIATEIAMDHLEEDPEYYDKLISSGIADEEDAVNTFNKLRGKSARKKAKEDVEDFMDNDEGEEVDIDDDDEDYYDDEEGPEEDELGADKVDFQDNEKIFDEEDEPKNKSEVMEKSKIKKYSSFINEEVKPIVPPEEPTEAPTPSDAGPERKYSKENKYKFQLPFNQNVVDKLNDYSFVYHIPDGEKETSKPKKGTHFIVIDMMNLNYAVIEQENPDIRPIEPSRLKNLLENL